MRLKKAMGMSAIEEEHEYEGSTWILHDEKRPTT